MDLLHIKLFGETKNSTLSTISFIKDVNQAQLDGLEPMNTRPLGFILEDGFREIKVKTRTRIPHGFYELERVVKGDWYRAITEAYPDHKFIVGLKDVENFELIRIHWGNSINDTWGCPLIGSTYNMYSGEYKILSSRKAYVKYYDTVEGSMLNDNLGILVDRRGSRFESPELVYPKWILPSKTVAPVADPIVDPLPPVEVIPPVAPEVPVVPPVVEEVAVVPPAVEIPSPPKAGK